MFEITEHNQFQKEICDRYIKLGFVMKSNEYHNDSIWKKTMISIVNDPTTMLLRTMEDVAVATLKLRYSILLDFKISKNILFLEAFPLMNHYSLSELIDVKTIYFCKTNFKSFCFDMHHIPKATQLIIPTNKSYPSIPSIKMWAMEHLGLEPKQIIEKPYMGIGSGDPYLQFSLASCYYCPTIEEYFLELTNQLNRTILE